MNMPRLSFTRKIIVLIFFLVILVSIALMMATTYLFNTGKENVRQGVAEKLKALREDNLNEIGKFASVADDGIKQASGLAAINNIISISTENQERFIEVAHDAVEDTGNTVARAVNSQAAIVSEGLDELLVVSTDTMDEIMATDNRSMNVLTNVATFSLNSLTTSSLDGLKRFSQEIEHFEQEFMESQDRQNEAIDDFLIQLITQIEQSGQNNDALIELLVEAFEELKGTSVERQRQLYQRLKFEFDAQASVVAEELTLVDQKVRYAITLELANATAIQEEQIDAVIDTLLENQFQIQEQIDKESRTLTQTVENLKTTLPSKLRQEGTHVLEQIEEQSQEASQKAQNAKTDVSAMITASIQATVQKFETGIGETQQVITETLDSSAARAFIWSVSIAVACVAISVGMGIISTRALTKPLNRVAHLVKNVSDGDFSETLALKDIAANTGRKDEIGILANAVIEMKRTLTDVLKETADLIHAIQKGRLDTRGNVEGFTGDWRELIVELNDLIDAFVAPINVTAEYLDRIAKGEIPDKLTEEYQGDFNELKNNVNGLIGGLQELTEAAHSIANGNMSVQVHKRSETDVLAITFQHMQETVRQLIREIHALVKSALQGQLSVRGDIKSFRGDFAKIMHGINMMMDAVVGPLNKSAEYVERLSKGDIPDRISQDYQGDFNTIKNNLNLLIDSTHDVTTLAHEIAEGNLRVTVEPRSDQDELMKSLQTMVAYLQEVADVTEKISHKDLQVVVRPKSTEDVLNQSLQTMVTTLQTMMGEIEQSMAEIQQQNWLRTGQAELSNRMRGEQPLTDLARNILTYLATHVQAQIGALYLVDNENSALQLVGSYAYTVRRGDRSHIECGEGLVGQAALEKQRIVFTDVPENYITISSGLGQVVPRMILVVPFLYEDEVRGVIELGTTSTFTPLHQHFLEEVAENIAIVFHSAQTRRQVRDLLKATQQQAAELQAQQENLRVANEELETQTQSLRESEQQLQSQQEELRQTNEELEAQTKALEEQQRALRDKNLELEKAQQIVQERASDLEMANKYKSEFLANMSHELRTPLNSLLILSKLLQENRDRNLTEKQLEFVHTIHTAGTELLDLINEILDLSKLEAGKMEIHVEDINLKGLLNYVKQHFTHMAQEKGLTLTAKLAKGLPASIRTDQQRVEQIIKNLLSNAIKFTTEGGITVTISRPANTVDLSRSGLIPQQTIAISVSDTGVGIPEEKQRVIFEAFQQADGSTSRKYGGTGLGLSITRELTRLLSGAIHLRSEAGKGSTFTLYLPETPHQMPQEIPPQFSKPQRIDSYNPSAQRPQTSTITPPAPARRALKERNHHKPPVSAFPSEKWLLIIEDDPKFAKLLDDLAHTKGFKCLLAAEGAEGLKLARQNTPNAIILDIGLPDMDGREVMGQLKKNPETSHIPVHVISGRDISAETKRMGAIGHLTKPVTPEAIDDVFKTLETAISHPIKKLLIVETDETLRKSMSDLLKRDDVNITTTVTGQEAYQFLQTERFDLLILDLDLEDMSGFDLLEMIRTDLTLTHLSIIVHTEKELTKQEETRLKKYAKTIILKGEKAEERLLDEATLFLHHVEMNLPEDALHKPRILHDHEEILTGKTILVVDDDMRNVFALSNVLEEKGMMVIIAENGKEALKRLTSQDDIDLVLMDIMMPEMDGYETMQQIRQDPKFRKLPIIALTAKAMKGDRQKCIDAGANDYLPKPIHIDKLFSLLRIWLY